MIDLAAYREQRRAVLKGLAALDTMADQWADDVHLPAMIKQMMSKPDAADRVETLVKLAWAEGAYAGRKSTINQPTTRSEK